VIHFLVNLVRLRISTCSRLPVLFPRREVAEPIVLLDYAMKFSGLSRFVESKKCQRRSMFNLAAPQSTPTIDADDNTTPSTNPLRTLMTIFDYIDTPTCTTVVPPEATWAQAANPATQLDGNHQGDLDELSNFLHPFWSLEDSFLFRLLQRWNSSDEI